MKKIVLIVPFLAMQGCIPDTANPVSGKDLNPKFSSSALVARDAGIVDLQLQVIYRYYNQYNGDFMDHIYGAGSGPTGYTFQSSNWYGLPTGTTYNNSSNPVRPIYNLSNSYTPDWMTSTYSAEGSGVGYSSQFQIGNFFVNRTSGSDDWGLTPIYRYGHIAYSPTVGNYTEHLTAAPSEPLGSGYTQELLLGYGWPAYTTSVGSPVFTSLGNISIGVSPNWGGAISHLYKGSTQYIKNEQAGELIQSAMWYGLAVQNYDNPTEAGDKYNNGSPRIYIHPNSPVNGAVDTRCIAMQWGDANTCYTCSSTLKRHNVNQPVLSGTEIHKTASIINDRRIKYDVSYIHAKNPSDLPSTSTKEAWHEVIAAYLRPELGYDHVTIYQFSTSNGWQDIQDYNATSSVSPKDKYVSSSNKTVIVGYKASDPSSAFGLLCLNPVPGDGSHRTTAFGIDVNRSGPSPYFKINIQEGYVDFFKGSVSSYTDYILLGSVTDILNEAYLTN